MKNKFRYWFKFQWKKPIPVDVPGNYTFWMKEVTQDGEELISFIGAGWSFVPAVIVAVILLMKLAPR